MSTQSTNTEAQAPTGDIKIFIDAFNKDFDIKLKSLLDAQQNYKNIYADAIKITTPKKGRWPLVAGNIVDTNTGTSTDFAQSDPKVVTIGDLFKYTFPDINSDKIVKPDRYSKEYGGWVKDLKGSEDEKVNTMYDKIADGIISNRDIEIYQSLKKPGITNPSLWSPGQYYFDVFMSQMLSPYGPLKDPSRANAGEDAFGGNIIEGGGWENGWLKANGGSASVSNFSADAVGATGSFGYIAFYEIIEGGDFGIGIKYKMKSLTDIDIKLDDADITPPKSFSSLFTQYRTGPLNEFISVENGEIIKKDEKFNLYEGIIKDPLDKEVEIKDIKLLTDITGYKFVGYYEHMLLYKAFIQAGDNYKSVVLPVRGPEPEAPMAAPAPLIKVESSTAVGEVQFKFNVEKTDTFVVVGGTVSPPLELIIVPNDGTKYIIDTPDVFNDDDLDEEYKEGEFVGLQEQDMIFEVAESLGVGTEVEFPTPPLDPNTPPGPGSGTTGPGTYKEGNGMSAKEWESKGTVVIGSKVPSNLSGPAKYNQNVKLNKTMTNEYLPAIKGITGYTNGAKLLAIVMAQKEGFASGTRSYRTNNPGNIGNTDSGSNKTLKTLADGIKLQLDYITKVAKGQHTAYPIGKEKNMKPYYSPEIAKNNGPNGPYKGMTAYLPGYKFTYTGMIEQYCKIYATGARTGNSYITMIVSWYRQNGYNWVTEETTLAQLIEQNLPNSFA